MVDANKYAKSAAESPYVLMVDANTYAKTAAEREYASMADANTYAKSVSQRKPRNQMMPTMLTYSTTMSSG